MQVSYYIWNELLNWLCVKKIIDNVLNGAQ